MKKLSNKKMDDKKLITGLIILLALLIIILYSTVNLFNQVSEIDYCVKLNDTNKTDINQENISIIEKNETNLTKINESINLSTIDNLT